MDNSVETVGNFLYGSQLRREVAELREENRYLRRRVRVLTASRDHWRQEARLWKCGALR